MQPQVQLATTFEELESWGPAYDRFLDQLGDYALFYRRGWLRAIWPAYSLTSSCPYFLSAWQSGEMVGLAPLQRLQKGPLQGWRRVLHFFGAHHYTLGNPRSDFLIAREEQRAACLRAFADMLRHHRDQWDLIDLAHWPEASPSLPLLSTVCPNPTLTDAGGRSAQVLVAGGFDAYFASLSANLRNHLRRHRRRLEANESGVAFHATDHLTPERWSAIARMHRNRQEKLRAQRRDRRSIFDHPVEARALLDALTWAEQAGQTRHYWLDIQGAPVAFVLGLHQGQTYYYYFVGMDEPAEPYSGGLLLLGHLIEAEARYQGTHCINLGFGENRNKRRFANQVQRHVHVLQPNRHSVLSITRNHWMQVARSLRDLPRLVRTRVTEPDTA